MNTIFVLLSAQALLGAFDNLWHHELGERLPAKRAARLETALHAARELLYAGVFIGMAWWHWHGAWSLILAGIFIAELGITVTDFLVEDSTRRLPRLERVLHTLLAINIGAVLALLAPVLIDWSSAPTALVWVDHGLASRIFTLFAIGVFVWGLRDALAAWRWFRPAPWQQLKPGACSDPRRVLVTGATGFIGRHLVRQLVERGEQVTVLTRDSGRAHELFGPHAEIVTDLEQIPSGQRVHAIVNLAGAPIAALPWTQRRRHRLLESRLRVTQALLDLVARLEQPPETWINASAIGYYGARDDELELHEKSPPGSGFQAELCKQWEALAAQAALRGVKTSWLRIGLVLHATGGALPALARPVRFGLGSPLGSGRQWVSWIHLTDLLRLILFVLDERSLAGPINATAPKPATHAELMGAVAASLQRRLLPVKVPSRLLRAALGELAELFVDGQRVIPHRAIALGFSFEFDDVGRAVRAALSSASELRPEDSGNQPDHSAVSSPQ